MTKMQMINELIRLYDENVELKRMSTTRSYAGNIEEKPSELFKMIYDAGQESMCKRVFAYGRLLETSYRYKKQPLGVLIDEEDSETKFNFLTFDQWIKIITLYDMDISQLPVNISFADLIDNLKPGLLKYYNAKVSYAKGMVLQAKKEMKN